MRRSFTIDLDRPYEVEVFWSDWTGLETYSVDGRVLLRVRSFAPSGTRRFSFGTGLAHTAEIRFVSFPFVSAQVYVDGEPCVDELVPGLHLFSRLLMFLAVLALLAAIYLALWAYA